MRLALPIVLAFAVWAAPAGTPDAVPTGSSGEAAGCVHWEAEARFVGLGYDHLVHLDNQCEAAMTCEVTTDVNPDPVSATLEPATEKTVTTFKGSPASEFTPTVTCEKADPP